MVATHDLNDTTRSRTMEYDGLDRLVEAQSAIFGGSGVHRFEYDAVDNLMHWTLGGVKDYARYVYGADNRLAQIQGTGGGPLHTFSHDVQGNVTDKDSTDYHFDLGNRLRLVATPKVTESYRYDGHGRRVLAWTSAGSKLSMYSATGQILYQQLFPASQNKSIDYITLSGSLVANREVPLGGGTAVVKYQHTDALGSPVAVTDSAGAVVERTDYDPYGGVIGGPKDGIGYTGHVMDARTGLNYMQQRYYDPDVGRFLSVDPVTAYDGENRYFNRYTYTFNSPYKFTDPDGRENRLGIVANLPERLSNPSALDVKIQAFAQRSVDLTVNAVLAGGTPEQRENAGKWKVVVDPHANGAPRTGRIAETRTGTAPDGSVVTVETTYSNRILGVVKAQGEVTLTGMTAKGGDAALLAIGGHELAHSTNENRSMPAGQMKEANASDQAVQLGSSSPDVGKDAIQKCDECFSR